MNRSLLARTARSVLLVVGMAALTVTTPNPLQGQNPNPRVAPVHSHTHGKTYGEWAAAWWQYVYSIPVSDNPLFDETGANAGVGQSGSVFFLVGVINVSGTANRTITVPPGKALFFPVLNFENDNLCPPNDPPLSVEELRAGAKALMDAATDLSCQVDGVPIRDLTSYRVQGPVFSVTFPDDNIFQFFGCDVPTGTYSPFVNDGFYLMLEPLPAGPHTIHFHGSIPDASFTLDITYHITVR
jgi:hypothetical protein